jgi:serine protease Do
MKRIRTFLVAAVLALATGWLVWAGGDDVKISTPPPPDTSKDKPLPAAFLKPVPENVDDLKAIEKHVQEVLAKVLRCTVCVRAGGSGSGVIVSPDGIVLTAGHVSGQPGRDITILTPDGKTHKGKTLGGNGTIDSGLVKFNDKGPWPFVEMGRMADVKKGDWCLVTGHPGGFKQGRSPPVRVGRILEINDTVAAKYIRTDCTLVGGDSGGPVFDMQGRVIGIHSRIGGSITANMHVPIDTYRETWPRLVKGERWGKGIGKTPPTPPPQPDLGFQLAPDDKACTVSEVVKDSPADKAGLKPGDMITKLDGKEATTAAALREQLGAKKPGDTVTFEVRRGSEMVTLRIVAGRKQGK